ncbi:DUF58 domain-containing protein [Bowmanella denitrificans]|uniref:DUF58 domain-containing protein n=1 Tax=Bowmanella denitrificans TaxID=366582 RepID=UPI000C9A6741|nr:DUF58 domain-containing protein [Bowmanella denitrificans]
MAGFIQQRLLRWLDKRIPAQPRFSLHRGNIFIFPSRFGWLYLLLCLTLFILGTNYQNNLILLLSFFLMALMLVSLFSSYLNFAGLNLQPGKLANIYAGNPVSFPLWIESRKEGKAGKLHLAWFGEKVQSAVELDNFTNPATLNLFSAKRGKLQLPRLTLCSYYPLGLFRCWTHLAFDFHLIVYPTPMLPLWPVSHRDTTSAGQQSVSCVKEGQDLDDFDSLTDYRLGQPLYHIAWKQAAKGQGLLSKKFSSQTQQSGWLILHHIDQHLEDNLCRLCQTCLEMDARGWEFGLDIPGKVIPPGKGKEHVRQCLVALALVKGVADVTS